MSQTTQRPRTQRPKNNKPKKKKQQRPKKVQPTYVTISKPIKPIMNPATLRTTTRRTPAVSSTLSPETIMMEKMRQEIMGSNPPRPIARPPGEDGLGILDLFPDMILTTTTERTTTTRPVRFPQDNNNPRQRISSVKKICNRFMRSISLHGRVHTFLHCGSSGRIDGLD